MGQEVTSAGGSGALGIVQWGRGSSPAPLEGKALCGVKDGLEASWGRSGGALGEPGLTVTLLFLLQEVMKVSDGSLLGEPRRTPLSKKEGVKWQRPRLTRQALMRCCLVKWVLSSAAPQGSGRGWAPWGVGWVSVLSSETSLRTPAWTSAGRGFHSFTPVPVHQSPCPTGHRARGGAQGGGECGGLAGVLPARRMGRGFSKGFLAGWVTFSIALFLSPL